MAQIQGLNEATSCLMLLIQCLFPHSTCRYIQWMTEDWSIHLIRFSELMGLEENYYLRDCSHKCNSLWSLGLSISKMSMISVWYLTNYISGRIQRTGLIDDIEWSGLGLIYDGQRHGVGADQMYIQLELGTAPMGPTGHKTKHLYHLCCLFIITN